jgi:hypothetical protein
MTAVALTGKRLGIENLDQTSSFLLNVGQWPGSIFAVEYPQGVARFFQNDCFD